MTVAEKFAERTAMLSAFNLTSEERGAIIRSQRNQYGVRVSFADGSAAFVAAGTADVRAVA